VVAKSFRFMLYLRACVLIVFVVGQGIAILVALLFVSCRNLLLQMIVRYIYRAHKQDSTAVGHKKQTNVSSVEEDDASKRILG